LGEIIARALAGIEDLANAFDGRNFIETVWGRGLRAARAARGRSAHPGLIRSFIGAVLLLARVLIAKPVSTFAEHARGSLLPTWPRQQWRGFCLGCAAARCPGFLAALPVPVRLIDGQACAETTHRLFRI
jgi:hypothetical protein